MRNLSSEGKSKKRNGFLRGRGEQALEERAEETALVLADAALRCFGGIVMIVVFVGSFGRSVQETLGL